MIFAKLIHRFYRTYWQLFRPVTLGARIILVEDGQVVLVKHSYGDHWYLPGGGVKPGESFEEAARREALEEVGATGRDLQLLGIYHNLRESKSDHIAIFSTESFELQPTQDVEIKAVARFDLSNLPKDVSPATGRRIGEYSHRAGSGIGAGAAVVSDW